MNDALTTEITALERRYWQALLDGDNETALELTADPSIVTGAQGVMRFTKKHFASMMGREQSWKLKSFEFHDVEVERLAKDVAIIGYKVHEIMEVDGKPLTLDAADASTWVRKDGRWACALHTETILGDPFGRDRKAN